MKRQKNVFIAGTLAIIYLLCSCSQQGPPETAISNRAFLKQTQSLANTGHFIVRQIKARVNSNQAAKIYYEMGHALDSTLYSVIDSSQATSGINTDSLGEVLKRKYNHLIDSIKNSVQYPLFMTQDQAHVYMNNPADSIEKGDYQGFVRNAQCEHLKILQIIRACYADYAEGFDLITKMGTQITLTATEKKTKIKLHFRYSARAGNFSPTGKLRMTGPSETSVPFTNLKINGDTIFLETSKLKKGNYTISAGYHELNINGWERNTEIEFPFQITD